VGGGREGVGWLVFARFGEGEAFASKPPHGWYLLFPGTHYSTN
jgi:hypothetical protein